MKKAISNLALFVFLMCCFKQVQAQEPVFNLCYNKKMTKSISVTSNIDIETMTIFDKLKFKNKEYVNNYHGYLDANGDIIQDVHFVSHENMFPQWYTSPTTIRTDISGTQSFFAKNSKHLPEGWVGAYRDSSASGGVYIEEGGERYLQQAHSGKAYEAYVATNEVIQTNGFLKKYIFNYPNSSELTQLQNEGYTVTNSSNVITVKDASIILVWDVSNKIFALQHIDNGTVLSTTKTFYAYSEIFNTDLVSAVVETKPMNFENGDCYESVVRTEYANYRDDCNIASFKSNQSEEEVIPQIGELELSPNPTTNQVTINIPESKERSIVQVIDLNGQILIERRTDDKNQLMLNVSQFPAGIYFVKLQQGSEIYSSKFVKQ